MEGRNFLRDLGEFAQYLDHTNQRSRIQQLQQQRAQQQRTQQQYQQQQQQQREQQQRQQRQQQQQQPQRDNRNQPKEQSGGFGYFLAAFVGVAAGFIAKSFFSEEEKSKSTPSENVDQRGYYNQNPQANSKPQPVDPVDAELEECNDLVCPITLELMREPMISKKCGHSFEQDAIVSWTRTRNFCPKCHAPLQDSDLVKNYSLKNAIEYMRKQAKAKEGQEAGQA